MAIYAEALQEVREACTRYRQQSSNLDDLQAALWKAIETVVAVEERELRDFLQRAEGELEMVQFTANQASHAQIGPADIPCRQQYCAWKG